MATMQKTIRKLLSEAFSIDEMRTLLHDLGANPEDFIPENAVTDVATRGVTAWAFRQGKVKELLAEIEEKNPKRYQEYKDEIEKLLKDEDGELKLERARDVEGLISEEFQSLKAAKISAATAGKKSGSKKHPLSGSQAQAKAYFDGLNDKQKAFLATAALFGGLQRDELMFAYREALKSLRISES